MYMPVMKESLSIVARSAGSTMAIVSLFFSMEMVLSGVFSPARAAGWQ